MAVIDPSEPNAGTKKGGKVREPAHRVMHCWREGLVFLRSGRSSTASPCRSRSAGFSGPHGSTDTRAHDATEMQADPRRCRGPVRTHEAVEGTGDLEERRCHPWPASQNERALERSLDLIATPSLGIGAYTVALVSPLVGSQSFDV
jgi:hypothetical protein